MKNNTNKIIGAVLSSCAFSILYILFALFITYMQFTDEEKIPWLFYFIIILFLIVPVIAINVSLVARIKEIKGGEEDEASKY